MSGEFTQRGPTLRDLILFGIAVALFLIPEIIVTFIAFEEDPCVLPVANQTVRTAAELIKCQQDHPKELGEILRIVFLTVGFAVFAYWVVERFTGIAERMSLLAKEIKTADNSSQSIAGEIKTLLLNRGEFYFVGTAKEAHQKISERFAEADTIYNMHVPYGTDMTYTLSDPVRIERIEKFLDRPSTKYVEIVGREAFLKYGKAYQEQIGAKLHREGNGLYVTDQIFPFLNFTILHTSKENGEVDKEVWFGWGGFSDYYSGEVYRTRAIQAVAMFVDMFNTVKEISNNPNDKRSLIARLQDYRGFWIDVARHKNTKQIENCAVLGFGFEASSNRRKRESRLCVKGAAYQVENGRPGQFVRFFGSETCELRDTTVHVSNRSIVGRDGGGAVLLGQSTYDFSKVWLTGQMVGLISYPDYGSGSLYIETVAVRLPESVQRQLEELWPLDRDGVAVDFEKVRKVIKAPMSALLAEVAADESP